MKNHLNCLLQSSSTHPHIVFIIDSLINRERHEQQVFKSLLGLVPGLEERLMSETTSEQDVRYIADLVSSSSIL